MENKRETHSCKLGDVSFAYRERGGGDPMVLVHANISDLRSWEPLEPLVAEHFRVINYSRRFAHPNRPADNNASDAFSQHVEDLIALIEKLRLGKVHLATLIPGAMDVCVPNASHLVHEDNPQAVAEAVRTFCKEH